MRFGGLIILCVATVAGCDHGLAPPSSPRTGAIDVQIVYACHPGAWPVGDSLHDLRFVAMRFIPADTSDFLQLNRMAYSDRLRYSVPADTVRVTEVDAGTFFYSGVAQKFGAGPFDWRPVGIVEANDGIFNVEPNETTRVHVTVDFRNPPPFPPPVQ